MRKSKHTHVDTVYGVVLLHMYSRVSLQVQMYCASVRAHALINTTHTAHAGPYSTPATDSAPESSESESESYPVASVIAMITR